MKNNKLLLIIPLASILIIGGCSRLDNEVYIDLLEDRVQSCKYASDFLDNAEYKFISYPDNGIRIYYDGYISPSCNKGLYNIEKIRIDGLDSIFCYIPECNAWLGCGGLV